MSEVENVLGVRFFNSGHRGAKIHGQVIAAAIIFLEMSPRHDRTRVHLHDVPRLVQPAAARPLPVAPSKPAHTWPLNAPVFRELAQS